MIPRSPFVHDRRRPHSRRVGTFVLLIALVCGASPASGAVETSSDSVSAPAGVAASPPAPNVSAPFTRPRSPGGVLRADRVAHASFALAIGTGVGLSSREPAIGAGTVIALAVAKELLDDRFDRGDVVAGAVGAGLAWVVVAALTR